METTLPDGISESAYNRFRDVQGFMAHLLVFCCKERNVEARLEDIKDSCQKLPPLFLMDNIKMWHTYLVMFILMFHENKWENINYSGLPKLPDNILYPLTKHEFFSKRNIFHIANEFQLNSKERKVLKEVAFRLS